MAAAPAETMSAEQSRDAARFRWLVFAVFVLALSVRLAYFFGAHVDYPIRGDVVQYVNYAWNLIAHGTFSSASPESAQAPPDAFRGPGYPAFLAIWMALAGSGPSWYITAVMAQIIVGALLVPLSIAWTRFWLPRSGALVVGLLVALWPHAIVLSSTLLSETVFCATLLTFLYCAGRAEHAGDSRWSALAGFAGGAAYLVNPLAALFPPCVALLVLLRKQRRTAAAMIIAFVLVAGAWSARNALHPGMQGAWDRGAANFVEGSWPQYHAAYNARLEYASAREMLDAVGAEERLMVRTPGDGLHAIAERMSYDPGGYVRWYLIEKPYSLWDWWIGIGWGDVYFLQTTNSPFERQAVFRLIHDFFRLANPLFFGLAALAAVGTVIRYRRNNASGAFSLTLAASFFLYVTAVHTVLQTDPRYAVAYRPMEIALAVTACVVVWRYLSARRRRQSPS